MFSYQHSVFKTQQIWLSSSSPGSGLGGLWFESGSYQILLKIVLTAPQPVLVIMSSSKGNALAIKRRSSYLIPWNSRKRWYNSKSRLSDKIKGYNSNFQYCDSNIGLFFIAPCKVITFNTLCMIFVTVLRFFFDGSLSKVSVLPTCRSFSLLKAIAKRLPLLFTNTLKFVKERHLLLSQQLGKR